MLIRREEPADVAAIRDVTAAAFARPDRPGEVPGEAVLVEELRDSAAWIPALSMVAIGPDGDVVGHVLGSRGMVGSVPAVALGPISVHPDHQRRGIGHALMHAFLGAADAMGEPLVALLGSPEYYSRFGFRAGSEYGILPPAEWGPHFQVRTLAAYDPGLRGTFTYAEPFSRF